MPRCAIGRPYGAGYGRYKHKQRRQNDMVCLDVGVQLRQLRGEYLAQNPVMGAGYENPGANLMPDVLDAQGKLVREAAVSPKQRILRLEWL